jgi:hypothetical protein
MTVYSSLETADVRVTNTTFKVVVANNDQK